MSLYGLGTVYGLGTSFGLLSSVVGLNGFNANQGTDSGRIEPVNHFSQDGDWSYVFGSDTPGRKYKFNLDDGLTITQNADFDDTTFVLLVGLLRPPQDDLPSGWSWKLGLGVDGTFHREVTLPTQADIQNKGAGEDNGFIEFRTLGLNVSQVTAGNHNLSVRLRLDGPGFSTPSDRADLELPQIYLDALTFDTSEGLVLFNQTPQPGDLHVPQTVTTFSLELADTDGNGIDLSNTTITIEGLTAYTSGAFQAGFSGSTTSSAFSSTIFDIDVSSQSYNSEQVINVDVVSQNSGNTQSINSSYQFTLVDTDPPAISFAEAQNKTVIRVKYNEDINLSSSTNANSALNPANYTFTRQSAPATTISASSVAQVASDTVDITLNRETTKNAVYLLTASNVEDQFGNAIVAPNNSAVFTAKWPAAPAGRKFRLYDMMPAVNRREDITQDLENFLDSLQDSLDVVLCSVDNFTDIANVDTAPESFVDAMLCDLGNPFKFNLSLNDKRKLATQLVRAYKQKGTCIGIINLVRFFVGVELTCDEFNNPANMWILGESELDDGTDVGDTILGPNPNSSLIYSFKLISNQILTDTQRSQIADIANYMKPAYTHFLGITEPTAPSVIDHLELGLSELGTEWELH